jgi:hypothetical protein
VLKGTLIVLTLTGIPPDELEKKSSELLESYCDKAIEDIEKSGEFKGDNRKYVLNLIALIAIRNPSNRKHWDEIEAHLAKVALSAIETAEVGSIVNGKIITQELKDFIESEQYDIKFPRNYQIEREINVFNGVIDLLFRRKWTLALAPTDLFFITCDRPVHLISSTPDNQIHFSGFGLKNRQVIFPLSKKTVLIGDLGGKDESITARSPESIQIY